MDAFNWSLPLLCQCVAQMNYAVVSQNNIIYDHNQEKEKLFEKNYGGEEN